MYLYFIQAGENGPIKIGVTDNIEKRLVTLQTGNYEKLKVIFTFETEEPEESRKWERIFHRQFRHQRLNGEWFRPDKYLLENIEQLKKGTLSAWAGFIGFDVWVKISDAYQAITLVAKEYREKGNIDSLKYIIAELEELIEDIKSGRN